MPAHVAPLDILFYYGSAFPGVAAFVTWHGSWTVTLHKAIKQFMLFLKMAPQ
jgi:glucose/arabinose dehydrogenase